MALTPLRGGLKTAIPLCSGTLATSGKKEEKGFGVLARARGEEAGESGPGEPRGWGTPSETGGPRRRRGRAR